MINKPGIRRMAAFSILEVTVVLALMALLSALFFGALNRFSEQVAGETKIKNELNDWFAVRAHLWDALDTADSVLVRDNTATLWKTGDPMTYRIENDSLVRISGEETVSLKAEITEIRQDDRSGTRYIVFAFRWKNDDMELSYPLKAGPAERVNTYFSAKRWQQ